MKVSIITASYNYEDYIKETIESVLAQTYPDWEMVIVDDGSEDNSVEIIKSYCKKDARIKLFQHENSANKGLAETIKLGLKMIQNEWVIFLESDDTIEPNYIKRKLEIISKYSDVDFIFNDVQLFGARDRAKEYEEYFTKVKKDLIDNYYPANLFSCFKRYNHISTFSAVMLKKGLFDGVDFNCPIKPALDYYLWIQIAKCATMFYLDEKLTNWRMHDSYIKKYKSNNYESAMFEYKKRKFLVMNPFQKILVPVFYLVALFDIVRKNIIKIHPKDKEIFIFGKGFRF